MIDTWQAISSTISRALITRTAGAEPQRYAYERACRCAKTVDQLVAAMPARERPARIDLVRIAAHYACVGHTGVGRGRAVDVTSDGAELAADQLPEFLPHEDVELVLRILREHALKDTTLAEAQLLGDAVGLEDVGLVGLWNQTRVSHAQGRTLEQLIRLWHTQREYGYWNTRLRDSFHFDVARRVAQKRLAGMAAIYERMQEEAAGNDIQ